MKANRLNLGVVLAEISNDFIDEDLMEEAKKRLAERNGRGAANNQKSAMEGLNSAILAVSQSMNQMQSSGSASGFEQFLKRMEALLN